MKTRKRENEDEVAGKEEEKGNEDNVEEECDK